MLFFTGASVCVTGLLFASVLAQTPLPQVDLGYETHQAISFNVSFPEPDKRPFRR